IGHGAQSSTTRPVWLFELMAALLAASQDQLEVVPDVGPVVAKAVRDFLDQPLNVELLNKLAQAGVNLTAPMSAAAIEPQTLAGLTIVLTGTLPTLTREAATELILGRG